MGINWRNTMNRAMRATSLVLLLKGGVVGSVTMLALFGVTVPVLGPAIGIGPSEFNDSIAAVVGGLIGVVAAIKA